jgi:hypothetical protein
METTTETTTTGFEPGIDVLSTGSGHIEVRFKEGDPMEVERASRMITDMLRRGYALFVHEGETVVKVQSFDPAKNVYIVADGPLVMTPDPQVLEKFPGQVPETFPGPAESASLPGKLTDLESAGEGANPPEQAQEPHPKGKGNGRRGKRKTREIPMTQARATAVGRTAGG